MGSKMRGDEVSQSRWENVKKTERREPVLFVCVCVFVILSPGTVPGLQVALG